MRGALDQGQQSSQKRSQTGPATQTEPVIRLRAGHQRRFFSTTSLAMRSCDGAALHSFRLL
ncbi:hypothetical protein K505DRAFT_329432 [Melanomma pulvis-pyrius CBS 109.77]|uniref:Uncharacterized protein n=1 Tax=Melanomma pulvis-pyrius CBS 109.77 TaxID=1314802 RepID=A0A6A6WV50_9PLEO|nr:hypothetical protein K505DRAFT_329432 [Melanomma pulvis-pyrius CBS 109.77]